MILLVLRILAGDGIRTNTFHLDISRLDGVREIVRIEDISSSACLGLSLAASNISICSTINENA